MKRNGWSRQDIAEYGHRVFELWNRETKGRMEWLITEEHKQDQGVPPTRVNKWKTVDGRIAGAMFRGLVAGCDREAHYASLQEALHG